MLLLMSECAPSVGTGHVSPTAAAGDVDGSDADGDVVVFVVRVVADEGPKPRHRCILHPSCSACMMPLGTAPRASSNAPAAPTRRRPRPSCSGSPEAGPCCSCPLRCSGMQGRARHGSAAPPGRFLAIGPRRADLRRECPPHHHPPVQSIGSGLRLRLRPVLNERESARLAFALARGMPEKVHSRGLPERAAFAD